MPSDDIKFTICVPTEHSADKRALKLLETIKSLVAALRSQDDALKGWSRILLSAHGLNGIMHRLEHEVQISARKMFRGPVAPDDDDDTLPSTFEKEFSKTALASVLISIRKRHGLSQRAFAKVAGISHSNIQRIEAGEGTLDKIHEAFRNLGVETKLTVKLPDSEI